MPVFPIAVDLEEMSCFSPENAKAPENPAFVAM
jgi:hypothetical protein